MRQIKLVGKESDRARSYYKANDKISVKSFKLNWSKVDNNREMIKIGKKIALKKAKKILKF